MLDKKKTFIVTLALLIGFLAMFFGYNNTQTKIDTALETTDVVVVVSDVEAFSLLIRENLKIEKIATRLVDEHTVQSIEELIGLATTVPIYAGKPIDRRLLLDQVSKVPDGKQVVGVHIDAARAASVTEGDIVDVYWLTPNTQPVPSTPIATNARVVRVTDDKGVPVVGATAIMQNVGADLGMAKDPRIVYLQVKPNEVSYVINGSHTGNSSISFAKKTGETESLGVNQDVAEMEEINGTT